MSQKNGKFQPKPRSGGKKFGPKGGGKRPYNKENKDGGDRDRKYGSGGGFRDGKPSRGPRDGDDYGRGEREDRGYAGGEGKKFGKSGGFKKDGYKKDGFKKDGYKKDGFKKDGYKKDGPKGEGFKGDRKGKPFGKRDGWKDGDRKSRDGGRKPYDRDSGRKPYDRDGDRKPRGRDDDRQSRGRDDRPQKSWQRYDDARAPASYETRDKLKSGRTSYGAPSSAFLYGVHAVKAAILNPDRVHQRLLCTTGGYESIEKACVKALERGLNVPEVTYVEKEDISRLLPRDAVHQDVLLDTKPLEEVFLSDVMNEAEEEGVILVLDQVTDPHNVGAILRSAAAFGAVGVVVQKLNAPDVTGTLAKSASGAVEHVPLVREVNLSRAIGQLKEAGFLCIGLAEEGTAALSAATEGQKKVALVLGAEGEGLRRLVRESCDALARLPTGGEIGSLNVSNAAAVALYEIAR